MRSVQLLIVRIQQRILNECSNAKISFENIFHPITAAEVAVNTYMVTIQCVCSKSWLLGKVVIRLKLAGSK